MHLPLVPFGCGNDTYDASNGVFSEFKNLIEKLCVTESTYLNNKQKTYKVLDTMLARTNGGYPLPDSFLNDLLRHIVQHGQRDLAVYLIQHKANVGDITPSGKSTLLHAIKNHDLWFIKFLTLLGAKPEANYIDLSSLYSYSAQMHSCEDKKCLREVPIIRSLLCAHSIYADKLGQGAQFVFCITPPRWSTPQDILDTYNKKKEDYRNALSTELSTIITIPALVSIVIECLPHAPIWSDYVENNRKCAEERHKKFIAGTLSIQEILSEEI